MNSKRLEELHAELESLQRPGIAKTTPPSARDRWKRRSIERLSDLIDRSGVSQREFGEELLGVSESAVRRAVQTGQCLPLPWWLEALAEKRPDLVADFLQSFLSDLRRAS